MRSRPGINPFALAGALALIAVTAVAWVQRYALHASFAAHPSILPAAAAGMCVAWLTLTFGLWAESRAMRRA
jgi:hypothetical protein